MESCYSAATFEGGGRFFGGVAGFNHAELKNCYYDSVRAGSVTEAVGDADSDGTISGAVTGLKTDDMKGETAKDNMDGFDWSTVDWTLCSAPVTVDVIYYGDLAAPVVSFPNGTTVERGTMLAMYLVGGLMRSPRLRRKLGRKITEGMIGPYKRVLDRDPAEQ